MVFQPRIATLESLVQSSSLEMAELQRNRPPEREPKPFTLAVRVCCVIHRYWYLYAYSAFLIKCDVQEEKTVVKQSWGFLGWSRSGTFDLLRIWFRLLIFYKNTGILTIWVLMLGIALHSLFRLLTPVINVSRLRASDYRYIFYLTAVDDVFGTDYKRLGSVDTWFLPVFSLPNSNFLLGTPRLEFFLYRY